MSKANPVFATAIISFNASSTFEVIIVHYAISSGMIKVGIKIIVQ